MSLTERNIRESLNRMVADNGGRPIQTYRGEGGEVRTSQEERRIARERQRRRRQRQAQSRAAFRGKFAP
jgi:triphosphoribosyl-dephospho-CoA synthetase